MIILDTNVVSEAMKPSGDPVVMAWLDDQTAETLYLSSVTLAELLLGLARLPAGRRKERLLGSLEGLLELFGSRVLPFDVSAAQSYAVIAVRAQSIGKGFPVADGFIAAIAAAHGFKVATRDTGPFEAAGLMVINPWKGSAC